MTKNVLLSAAKEDANPMLGFVKNANVHFIHTPLEVYEASDEFEQISEVLHDLKSYQNIVYSSKRNAKFFLCHLNLHNKFEAVKQRLNVTFDKATFSFLEAYGIAAVYPQKGSKAIDVLEFMLRLNRLGKTLYPCGTQKSEDLPALLQELDIPVTTLPAFTLDGPSKEKLTAYRKRVSRSKPDVIIFHSRRSVSRTLAAFPDLDYDSPTIIAADKAITKKLQEKNISIDVEAEGSWKSIAEALIGE